MSRSSTATNYQVLCTLTALLSACSCSEAERSWNCVPVWVGGLKLKRKAKCVAHQSPFQQNPFLTQNIVDTTGLWQFKTKEEAGLLQGEWIKIYGAGREQIFSAELCIGTGLGVRCHHEDWERVIQGSTRRGSPEHWEGEWNASPGKQHWWYQLEAPNSFSMTISVSWVM